eukprot:TRINITY_DN24901_c1_g1_i1.p1 TRINITY_DN24901_c1_g1~~TRINITY_DN24901_c1_g1_i1.p1  ORF type:complete len:106 (+),score=23.03 TRINITY_DN24901_c1_g1_i1:62-379(+)
MSSRALERTYSAPKLMGSSSGFIKVEPPKRNEMRKLCVGNPPRSNTQLTAEQLDTQAGDSFLAETARSELLKVSMMSRSGSGSSLAKPANQPWWLSKDRKCSVWR